MRLWICHVSGCVCSQFDWTEKQIKIKRGDIVKTRLYKISILVLLTSVLCISLVSAGWWSDMISGAAVGQNCKKEGQLISQKETMTCCEGLTLIKGKTENEGLKNKGICTAKCGNGVCDKNKETAYNCPEDCTCGDKICNGNDNPFNCKSDCKCVEGEYKLSGLGKNKDAGDKTKRYFGVDKCVNNEWTAVGCDPNIETFVDYNNTNITVLVTPTEDIVLTTTTTDNTTTTNTTQQSPSNVGKAKVGGAGSGGAGSSGGVGATQTVTTIPSHIIIGGVQYSMIGWSGGSSGSTNLGGKIQSASQRAGGGGSGGQSASQSGQSAGQRGGGGQGSSSGGSSGGQSAGQK